MGVSGVREREGGGSRSSIVAPRYLSEGEDEEGIVVVGSCGG